MRTIGRHLPARLRACAVAGLGLLLALAATVGPPPAPGTEPGTSLLIRLPDAIRAVVLGLFALSVLLLLSLQRPRRRTHDEPELSTRPPRRPAVLTSLSIILLLVALVYLAWTRGVPGAGHPLEAPLAAIAALLELLALARKPPTSVPVFDYAIAGLALLLALAAFALMVLVVLAERLARWGAGPAQTEAVPPLHDALAEGLDDLRAEPDARAAIVRAYRRFELALSAARAPRAAWQTPSEFMRATLAQVPVPARPVARLTALFELARFSDRPLGADARDVACDCLDEVRTALEVDTTHAR